MRLVLMILIGSVLISLHVLANIGVTDELRQASYLSIGSGLLYIGPPEIHHNYEVYNSESSFDHFNSRNSFLARHEFSKNHIVGLKYGGFNANDNLRLDKDNSKLWILLQFTF